jgi:hypothetical protein
LVLGLVASLLAKTIKASISPSGQSSPSDIGRESMQKMNDAVFLELLQSVMNG